MRGVIAVIPAKKTFCKNQEKLTKNRDFYLKSVKKINNFRVRGVIVVIPAKKTFCRNSKNFGENLGGKFRVKGVIAVFLAQNF